MLKMLIMKKLNKKKIILILLKNPIYLDFFYINFFDIFVLINIYYMRCKVFSSYGASPGNQDEINQWLELNTSISIEYIATTESKIYIFYSTRKGKLNKLTDF
jgi:hypothetical protein